jgi:hypothetical protein
MLKDKPNSIRDEVELESDPNACRSDGSTPKFTDSTIEQLPEKPSDLVAEQQQ